MTITEKVAYIKGLLKGLNLDEKDPQNQVITAIVDVLGDISEMVTDDNARVADLEGYTDELDDDLASLEDEVYGDVDDEGCEGCPNRGDECDEDEDEKVCVECPNCGEVVYLDEDSNLDEIVCDNCGKKFSCKMSDDE